MEVTTVSPSPASPTEGDDLCEINVTYVAIHSVTLLLCLCGLVGNGAVLCLLRLKHSNAGIYDLALTDFLFLLFTVPTALLFLGEDVSCSPIMPLWYLNFLFQLSMVSYYWVLFWLTGTHSIVNLFEVCCRCRAPERLRWLVNRFQFWAFFALFTVIPTLTNLCPTHGKERCRAALSSVFAVILLLFVAPVVIFHTRDFIKAKWGSEKQQPQRRDIILFLVVLFILILSLCNFLHQLGYIVVPSQVFFLLSCIYSSIKPFIYFLAGRCWSPCSLRSLQLSLQRVFDEQKAKTARSNDAPRDTGLSLVNPSPALLKEPRTVDEVFLEPLDEYLQAPPPCGGSFLQEKGAGTWPCMISEECSSASTMEHGFTPPSWFHMAPSTADGHSSLSQLSSSGSDPSLPRSQGMSSISLASSDELYAVF